MRCGPVFCRSPYGFGTLSDICGVYWRDFAIFVLDIARSMKQKQIFTFRDAEKQVAPAAFSIMLKPAGSACNLDCHYCYYLDKAAVRGRQAVMDDQLLELLHKTVHPGQ